MSKKKEAVAKEVKVSGNDAPPAIPVAAPAPAKKPPFVVDSIVYKHVKSVTVVVEVEDEDVAWAEIDSIAGQIYDPFKNLRVTRTLYPSDIPASNAAGEISDTPRKYSVVFAGTARAIEQLHQIFIDLKKNQPAA